MNKGVMQALNKMKDGGINEAVIMIKQEAATNDITAQYYLAQCYEKGIGMEVDLSQAFVMYRRAAERGFPLAMKELSRLYSMGIGVPQNAEKAAEWEKRFQTKTIIQEIPDMMEYYNLGMDNTQRQILSKIAQPEVPSTSSVNNPHFQNITINHNVIVTEVKKEIQDDKNEVIKSEEKNIADVDQDIPITTDPNESVFVFIFANEDYHDVANVPYAINDGRIFAEYCKKTLAIPSSNIRLIENATLNNLRRELNLMKKISGIYGEEASFIIYYAGHGIPDELGHNAYLLPVDGFPADVSTCYRLSDFYDVIGRLSVNRSLVFLDACFSGTTRDDNMVAPARGVALKIRSIAQPFGKTIAMTSSHGSETSSSYEEKKHGLFTYFLLKKLQQSKGDTDLQSLFEYIKENVAKTSITINGKSQTPTILVSPEIIEEWEKWRLK